jgi:hypothetical protein
MSNFFKSSTYFTRVEDKYVFRVSTAFWHLIIGLVTLAAAVGIVMLLWSIIPAGKDSVKADPYPSKPAFPPAVKVTIADLKGEKQQPEIQIQETKMDKPSEPIVPKDKTDSDYPSYQLSVDELKKLFTVEQWTPGSWVYVSDLAKQMYPNDNRYRHWEQSGKSMDQYLDDIYNQINAAKYAQKRATVNSITKIVKVTPNEARSVPIQKIAAFADSRWTNSKDFDSLCTVIAANAGIFGKQSSEALSDMISFGLKNPNDAFGFIPFAVELCRQFPENTRESILRELRSAYRGFNTFEAQREATAQFNELIPQLQGMDPSQALNKFYTAYFDHNQSRGQEIDRLLNAYEVQKQRIDVEYNRAQLDAQIRYDNAQSKKSEWKMKSLTAIGGAFVAIALFGTILTLLSIQRILKRIEMVAEGNLNVAVAENKNLNPAAVN